MQLKITFCAFDFADHFNGPNTWLERLVPRLVEHGCQVEVLFFTLPGAGPLLDYCLGMGLSCPVFSWASTTEEKILWILEQVAARPPHVFLPNLVMPAYLASRWIQASGIPTVGLLHTDAVDPFYGALVDEFVLGPPAWAVSTLVCVSEHQARTLAGQVPDRVRLERIPYGCPVPERTASLSDGELSLVYSGRLVEVQKRARAVAHALCDAVQAVPGVRAALYGDGEARDDVEAILRARGEGRVRLHGRVESQRVQECLLDHQVMVLLSDFEGLPISLLEGMACGLVPVCLDAVNGKDELIVPDETGLIVPDRGEGFVAAVRRLAGDPPLWTRMSEGARRLASQRYSVEATSRRWRDLFADLAASSSQGPVRMPAFPLDLPPVHPALACEDFRSPGDIRLPRFRP